MIKLHVNVFSPLSCCVQCNKMTPFTFSFYCTACNLRQKRTANDVLFSLAVLFMFHFLFIFLLIIFFIFVLYPKIKQRCTFRHMNLSDTACNGHRNHSHRSYSGPSVNSACFHRNFYPMILYVYRLHNSIILIF